MLDRIMLDLIWKATHRERPILGLNERNREIVGRGNPRHLRPLVDDKRLTKEILEKNDIPAPTTLAIFDTGFHLMRGLGPLLEGQTEVVIKPSQGAGGGGILILQRGGEGWHEPNGRIWNLRKLQTHCQSILFGNFSGGRDDGVLIDERLHPGPALGGLETAGLPDIRVIVHRLEPKLAMIRIPTKESGGKANLHQGGIGVGVDLATGLTTNARCKGRPIEVHPDTGQSILGRHCEDWPLVLDIARRAGAAVPLEYLGVDIAPTREKGPVVLELNARPGLEIQNANHLGLRDLLGLVDRGGRA